MGALISWALDVALDVVLPPERNARIEVDDMIEKEILPVYEAPIERPMARRRSLHKSQSEDEDEPSPSPSTSPSTSPVKNVAIPNNNVMGAAESEAPARPAFKPAPTSKQEPQTAVSDVSKLDAMPGVVVTQTPELRKMWFEPEWTGFRVRSKNYLLDHAKVPTKEPLMELVWFDLFEGQHEDLMHVCRHRESFVQKMLSQPGNDLPHIFALTLLIPGSPVIACVQYFALKKDLVQTEANCEAMRLYHKFLAADDAFRNHRLKLIPSVLDGPWVVKKSVGNKPVILGNALQLQHFKTEHYLEICVDICSDRVAKHVTSLCRSMSTKIQIAMAFVAEGQESSELPERLLGVVAYDHLDLRHAVPLRN